MTPMKAPAADDAINKFALSSVIHADVVTVLAVDRSNGGDIPLLPCGPLLVPLYEVLGATITLDTVPFFQLFAACTLTAVAVGGAQSPFPVVAVEAKTGDVAEYVPNTPFPN